MFDLIIGNLTVNRHIIVINGYIFKNLALGFGRGGIFLQYRRNVKAADRVLYQILFFQILTDGVNILLFAPVGRRKEIFETFTAEFSVFIQKLNLRKDDVANQRVADRNFVFGSRFFNNHRIEVSLNQSGQHGIADFIGNFDVAENFLGGANFPIQLLVDVELTDFTVIYLYHGAVAGCTVNISGNAEQRHKAQGG